MIEMKDILVIVDVQKGFTKDYTVEKIPVIEDLLSRRVFDTVIATKYWNTPDSNISRLMGWKDLCTEEEQDLVPEIELSSNDLLIDLARIGLGIAFVPDFCIPADESQLYILKLAQSLPESWWWPPMDRSPYPRRQSSSWICCKATLRLPSIPEILQAPGRISPVHHLEMLPFPGKQFQMIPS